MTPVSEPLSLRFLAQVDGVRWRKSDDCLVITLATLEQESPVVAAMAMVAARDGTLLWCDLTEDVPDVQESPEIRG